MRRHRVKGAILLIALVFCFYGAAGSLAGSRLFRGGTPPSISDMLLRVARSEAQEEVLEAAEEARQLLDEDRAYDAKRKIMQLKATVEMTSADYRVIDRVERSIDEALGEELQEVTREIEQKLQEEELLSEYRRRKKVEQEMKKRSAAALAEKAETELYRRSNPQDALELAREAFALDPENKDAERLILESEAELSEKAAKVTQEAELLSRQARVRIESLKQEYNAIKRRAMQHQARGEYEEAKDAWRKAQTYVNVLSVYTDVDEEIEIVNEQLGYASRELEKIRQEEERQLKVRREREAEQARLRIEDELRAKEELEAEREADMINQAWGYVRRGRYDEARKLVNEMLLVDSTNEAALVLEDIITRREHDDLMSRAVQRREREDLALLRDVYDRATTRSEEITFPDRNMWQRVAGRDPVSYPSREIIKTEQQRDVEDLLKQQIMLFYDRHTSINEVVDEIMEQTGVSILVNTGAFEERENPPTVRARFETSARVALDHLVREGSRPGYPLSWKIDEGHVRIDAPENLKNYELRVYDVRDLLISVADMIEDEDVDPVTAEPDFDDGGRRGTDDADRIDLGAQARYRLERERQRRRRLKSIGLEERAAALERLIKSVIQPGTWRPREDIEDEEVDDVDDVIDPMDPMDPMMWMQPGGGDNDEDDRKQAYIDYREENPGDFLIVQTPEVHNKIEELLSELRKAIHIQVHVETRFVEVTESFLEEIGTSWDKMDFTPDFVTGDSGTRLSADIGTGIPVFTRPDGTEFPTRGVRFEFGIFEGIEMEAFLKAVRMSEHSRVTQTPSLTLMNTQRGQLWVRNILSFVPLYTPEDGLYTPIIDEVLDGIRLDIRPIVSSCRKYVYLEMKPEIEEVVEFVVREQALTITQPGERVWDPDERRWIYEDDRDITVFVPIEHPDRFVREFQNTVAVPDRGLLVVGGLGTSEEVEKETGIPILSKLPILGRLFGGEGMRREDKTLLILVRPRIIILDEEESIAF